MRRSMSSRVSRTPGASSSSRGQPGSRPAQDAQPVAVLAPATSPSAGSANRTRSGLARHDGDAEAVPFAGEGQALATAADVRLRRARWRADARGPRPRSSSQRKLQDDHERLDDDGLGHLAAAHLAVLEDDGHLHDARAGARARGRSSRSGRRSRRRARVCQSMASSVLARQALKPPVRSWGARRSTTRAKIEPPRETMRRSRPQSRTPPPRV